MNKIFTKLMFGILTASSLSAFAEEGQFQLLSVDPADGSTITPGTTINLFFNEDADIATCTDAVTITNTETGVENKVTLDWNWNTFDFSNLQFTMPKGLADGNYTATIEADLISGYDSGEAYGEISLSYTVAAGGGSVTPETTPLEVKNFTPAASEVQTLSNIINIGFKSQLDALADGATATLTNDASGKTYTGVMTIPEYIEKTVRVNFDYGSDADDDNALCVPGTYTLTIAADAIIGKDGGKNTEISNTWTVTGPIDLNDIEPSSVLPKETTTMTSLSSIMLTFPMTPELIKNNSAVITVAGTDYDFTIENNRLTVNINPEITTAGTYNVTVPAGAVYSMETGHGNKAISLTYTIEAADKFQLLSVEPASGSTIKPGTVINLFFNEEVDIASCTDAVTITNTETGVENKVTLDWNWNTFDFSNLQFTMPKGLADGNYTATIAADLLTGNDSGETYGEISLNYTVAGEEEPEPSEPTPVEVKNFTPAASEVQTLSNMISIGFKTQLESLAEGAVATLKNDETGTTYTGVMSIPEYIEKTVKVEFDYGSDADDENALCVPGTYTLTIAADAIIGKDGGKNAEITNSWTVIGIVDLNDIEYTSVYPADGTTLDALSSITINFPQTPELIKNSDLCLVIGEKEYDFTIENNVLSIIINPEITTDGTYTVTLPAGAVYSIENAYGNKEVTLTYIVSRHEEAIESIFADGVTSVAVFNCQGICILSHATVADLRNLPAGLYIANGKKFMKR